MNMLAATAPRVTLVITPLQQALVNQVFAVNMLPSKLLVQHLAMLPIVLLVWFITMANVKIGRLLPSLVPTLPLVLHICQQIILEITHIMVTVPLKAMVGFIKNIWRQMCLAPVANVPSMALIATRLTLAPSNTMLAIIIHPAAALTRSAN